MQTAELLLRLTISNVYLRNGVLFVIEASIEDIARKDVGARAAAGKIGRMLMP